MKCISLAVFFACWCYVSCDLQFPVDFKFGAATAAYQVEGAWNVSDKGESIWDRLTHTLPKLFGGNTGDVACDSYHKFKRDVQMAKELGLQFYRISIAWTRLLPTGFSNHISEDGKKYYNDVIDELVQNGIEPVITLYHWDLPQSLQDLGGWTNPLISDWFEDYARVAFSLYADRVQTWLTINEPIVVCDVSYNSGLIAPALKSPAMGPYLCTKHVLLAHAKAYKVYDQEFRSRFGGKVSLCNHLLWYEPATEDDVEITEFAREFAVGRYSHPIFSKEGGWPPIVEEAMAELSMKQGYSWSNLPAFTEEERLLVRGSYDFYGFNHYTSRLVRKLKPGEKARGPIGLPIQGSQDFGFQMEVKEEWTTAPNGWLSIVPEGIRRQLVWIKQKYGDVDILITENGMCTAGYNLEDDVRVDYYRDYLKQILLAIKEDGVKVVGYTAWTLMDNFEWIGNDPYGKKFGLYEVNFSDPDLPRTPRKSAKFYADVIKYRSLDLPTNYNVKGEL